MLRRLGAIVAWLLTALSIALMGYASFLMQPDRFASGEDGFVMGMNIFIGGVVALGVALFLWHLLGAGGIALHRVWRGTDPTSTSLPPINWRWFLAGMIPLIALVQINTVDLTRRTLTGFWYDIGLIHPIWQVGLLLWGWGMMLWALIGRDGMTSRVRWRMKREYGYLALIVVLGFVLRVWDIELWITRFLDEMHYMNAVARIREVDGVQILMPFSQVTAFSWLYPLAQSVTVGIFGTNFTGIRMLSVLSGTAQIIAVYWLGRAFLPRRTALLGALVLATFPAHIHFSKIGINNIADPVFGMMAFGYLLHGLRTGAVRYFVLAGAMIGMTHYFYEGGRLFFSLFAILWLMWFFLFGRRDGLRANLNLPLLMRMGIAWFIIIVPLYYVWLVQDVSLTPRFELMGDLRQQSVFTDNTLPTEARLAVLSDKLPQPVRGLVQMADTSWFYSGEQALVLWFFAPLLMLGVAHVFWRWRTAGASVLFWWLVAVLVANSFISDSVASPRYIIVMGVLSLLIAIGLTHSMTLILIPLKRIGLRRFLLRLTVLFIGIMIGVGQSIYYYGVHLPNYYEGTFYEFFDYRTGQRFRDTNDAILRAVELPPHTDVHIITPNLVWSFDMDSATLYYERPDMTIRHVFPEELDETYLEELSTFRNQAFFLEPYDGLNLILINEHFPIDMARSGLPSPYHIPHDSQLYLYFAPATYIIPEGATWK